MTFMMDTAVGPAEVLHRLALGVEPRDGVTHRPLSTAVRVGQEVPEHLLPRGAGFETYWPCLDFETHGTARFKLRHGVGGPNRIKVNADGTPPTITVRIDDRRRRFVPRRFRVPVWTRLELERADPSAGAAPPGPYAELTTRLIRPVLLPGSAYQLARGTTLIRGSVVFGGKPVRWVRVFARSAGTHIGTAHGDENGEFLLVVTGRSMMPAAAPPEMIDVVLSVYAVPPGDARAPDPVDRIADLVVEPLSRPLTDDPHGVLAGVSVPDGYRKSASDTAVAAPTGKELVLRPPIVFQP